MTGCNANTLVKQIYIMYIVQKVKICSLFFLLCMLKAKFFVCSAVPFHPHSNVEQEATTHVATQKKSQLKMAKTRFRYIFITHFTFPLIVLRTEVLTGPIDLHRGPYRPPSRAIYMGITAIDGGMTHSP